MIDVKRHDTFLAQQTAKRIQKRYGVRAARKADEGLFVLAVTFVFFIEKTHFLRQNITVLHLHG